ncbi:hypothetical protein JB92DRAFT_3044132 [Gautieria morchelliformis]|nr:hypothetical protein JB92DRAFT_3044132 [Gautieria morchelliformis]
MRMRVRGMCSRAFSGVLDLFGDVLVGMLACSARTCFSLEGLGLMVARLQSLVSCRASLGACGCGVWMVEAEVQVCDGTAQGVCGVYPPPVE